MDLLAQLRDHTRAPHHRLESRLNFLHDSFTLDEYIHMLKRFYGFYCPLEENLSDSGDLYHSWINLKSRKKSPPLINDLKSFGFTSQDIQKISLCSHQELPNLSPHGATLGCLYVLEGSNLGAQILSRHFKKRFQLTPESGLSFLSGDGEGTALAWKHFTTALNVTFNLLTTQLHISENQLAQNACQGARETFEKLESWLCRREERYSA